MKSKAIFILPPHSSDLYLYKVKPWNVCRIPPIGLMAIASYLDAQGHEVKIIDCRQLIVKHKTKEYMQLVLKIVEEFHPDVIGINVLTTLFYEAEKISRELKRRFPGRLVIAGGPHPSVEPLLTFQQNQHIDAICIGPGEEVCLELLDGKDIRSIPGLMFRDCVDRFEKRSVNVDIDKYPFPNYSLVDSSFYTDFTLNTGIGWGFRGLTTLTSRSCPYSCKFCASDWSKPFRYHSSGYVVEMAKYLSGRDVEVISFFDDTIAALRDRLHGICEGFLRLKLFWPYTRVRWFASIRANQVQSDILQLMKKAGCFGVNIGIESGSDRMLKVINKKATVEMNEKACSCVNEAGLRLGVSFMIGIPGETVADMSETIGFMKRVNSNAISIGTFRPLPGSPFYEGFVTQGILSKENIDWANLGDFSAPPKYIFCDVPGKSGRTLAKMFNRAMKTVERKNWITIHEDVLRKRPELIKLIASGMRIKICKSDNYQSSAHLPYTPFSLLSVLRVTHSLARSVLSFRARQQIMQQLRRFSSAKQ